MADEDVGRGSTEEELAAHKKAYRREQTWEWRREGESQWRSVGPGYQPGWFYDTEYRIKEKKVC